MKLSLELDSLDIDTFIAAMSIPPPPNQTTPTTDFIFTEAPLACLTQTAVTPTPDNQNGVYPTIVTQCLDSTTIDKNQLPSLPVTRNRSLPISLPIEKPPIHAKPTIKRPLSEKPSAKSLSAEKPAVVAVNSAVPLWKQLLTPVTSPTHEVKPISDRLLPSDVIEEQKREVMLREAPRERKMGTLLPTERLCNSNAPSERLTTHYPDVRLNSSSADKLDSSSIPDERLDNTNNSGEQSRCGSETSEQDSLLLALEKNNSNPPLYDKPSTAYDTPTTIPGAVVMRHKASPPITPTHHSALVNTFSNTDCQTLTRQGMTHRHTTSGFSTLQHPRHNATSVLPPPPEELRSARGRHKAPMPPRRYSSLECESRSTKPVPPPRRGSKLIRESDIIYDKPQVFKLLLGYYMFLIYSIFIIFLQLGNNIA